MNGYFPSPSRISLFKGGNMPQKNFTPGTTPDGYTLNVVKDIPDIRDRIYEPSLIQLKNEIKAPEIQVLDQEGEGACTGFGLAGVINLLNQRRDKIRTASPRMLYEMAKKYDQWPGENYEGSSCRGAIKGWYNMGVCTDELWPYVENDNDHNLTVARAKDARKNTLGAYYRLRHDLVDFHCALNEVGALYVSANVHTGWRKSRITNNDHIPFESEVLGGHAFAIIGYNDKGFWVQNSWGADWGDNGVALWFYEDWQKNIKDAWVVRLAVPVPQIQRASSRTSQGIANKDGMMGMGVYRDEIAGHFAHIDNGYYFNHGKYWSNHIDIEETARQITGSDKYDHLLIYAHGGLTNPDDSAKRIRAMKDIFKDNRIYSFHFMYDTGLMEELTDILLNKKALAQERVGGITEYTDKLLEYATRHLGRALWSEMKRDATILFGDVYDGTDVIKTLIKKVAKAKTDMQLHIVGHSNGSVLAANLLKGLETELKEFMVHTVSLMAPACTNDLFFSNYSDIIKRDAGFRIGKTTLYNLCEKLEKDDNVAEIYRKSLLYLISNAFEDNREMPLLGMEIFNQDLNPSQYGNRLDIAYSTGKISGNTRTASTSHGDFDNDIYTMNDILKIVTDRSTPIRPFTTEDLNF